MIQQPISPETSASLITDVLCVICGGTGWVSREVPLDHQDFGKAFPCECLMETFLKERPERLWKQTGIPVRFKDFTLGSSPLVSIAQRLLGGHPQASWLLWGERGVGKTGLAVGYARQFIEANHGAVQFYMLPQLLAALRMTYNRPKGEESDASTEAELITFWSRVPLLVLDDMGSEQVSGSGWVEDRLYQIIGQRHADLKPIFVTSNLSPAELGKRLGDRILWRIVEMCGKEGVIHVQGRNLRA